MIVTDMVAVGLPGVFKYGAKFLGYLVAVVVAAGVPSSAASRSRRPAA